MRTIIIFFFKILFHSLFFWGNFICLPFSGLQTGVSFPNVILSSKAASFLILFCCNSPGFVLSFTCQKSNILINFSSGFLLAKISNIAFICFVFFLFYLRLIIICSFPVFEISGEEEIYHYPNYYNLHFDWQAICQYCIQKIREDSSRHLHSYPFLLSAQRYAHISIK